MKPQVVIIVLGIFFFLLYIASFFFSCKAESQNKRSGFLLHGRMRRVLVFLPIMPSANELKEIKKEIVETRGLIIKSNNLANSLSVEVRSIAKRQTGYERRLVWSSVSAYIIFTVLIFAAVQLVFNQRKAALEEAVSAADKRAKEAEQELSELKKEHRTGGKAGGEDLMAVYASIRDGDGQAAIDAYDALDKEQLTPLEAKLLKDSVESLKSDLSMQHYSKGLDLTAEGKYADAVEEFRASLRFKGDAGHATAAKIEMANALRLQGKPREAIAILQRLMEEHLDRSLSDDAYWYLALSHYEAHQRDEAKSVLKALMRQFPDSQYYRAARVKAADIQLHLYSAED